MGWPFGRQRSTHAPRHAASTLRAAPPAAPALAAPPAAPPPAPPVLPAATVPTQPAPPGPAPEVAVPVPSVRLGFRDGTTYDVRDDSAYARALRAVADALTARDR